MKDHGYFSVDAVGGLIVMLILLPIMNSMWQAGIDLQQKRAVAEHFMAIQQAAFLYGKQNHHLLTPQITATAGPTITVANLKSANCLPYRFSEVNAWQQGYAIHARKDSNDKLAMVVMTTGGQGHSESSPKFANVMVPETAAMAKAGFIPTGLIGSGAVLRGAYGGWEVPLASMGLSGSAGHLGAISTLSSSDLDQDILYRVAVPGLPELNAMQTSLDMTGHDINNVGSIGFTDKDYDGTFCTTVADEGRTFLDKDFGLYLCRNGKVVLLSDSGNSLSVQGQTLGWHGMLVDKPTCAAGTGLVPEIFVSQALVAAGAETHPMVAAQTWATEYSPTQWQINLRVKTSLDEWVYPTPDYGRVVVTTTCTSNAN